MTISFKNINPHQDFEIYLKILRSAHEEVNGSFNYDLNTINKYIDKCFTNLGPNSFWHMYNNNILIGQLELDIKDGCGYVHLFYIFPEFSKHGYFKHMHTKMLEIMREQGFSKIQLSTPPTNMKTIDIYHHYGWVNVGADPNKEDMIRFELKIA